MKKITKQLKNVTSPKETFKKFLSHFNTIKKLDREFYAWDDRRIDYTVLSSIAKSRGVKLIPTKTELDSLI